MSTVILKTAAGDKYFSTTGSGTVGDPYVIQHEVTNVVDVSGSAVDVTGTVDVQAMPTVQAEDAGFSAALVVDHKYAASADGTSIFDVTDAPTLTEYRELISLFVSVDTACEVTLKDDDAVTYASGFLPANSGFEALIPRAFIRTAAANAKFQIVTSIASKVRTMSQSISRA